MSTADIALARQQEGNQESAFPWLALLPLALIPLFGTSVEGLQRILLMVQEIFFFLGMRRPVWILAALMVSELTIANYVYGFGSFRIGNRLILALTSIPLVLPPIRYHRQGNQGLVASLNRGMEMAKREYVRFLEADDVLLPDSLSGQVALLDRNPQVGLVHGQAYAIDEAGKVCGLRKPLPTRDAGVMPSPQAFRWLLRGSAIRKGTVMARKAALQRVGPFQQESVPGEDWDAWLRIAAYYDQAYIPRPLAYYRVHQNSITAGYTLSSFTDSHLNTLRTLFARPDLPYPQLENLAYACLDRNTALVAARLRHRGPFARHLRRALRSQPRLFLEGETWNTLYEGAKAFLPLAPLRVVRGAKRTIVGHRRAFAGVVTSAPRLGGDAEKRRLAEAEAARGMEGESHA